MRHRLAGAVAQLQRPAHGGHATTRMAHRGREHALRVAREPRVAGREERHPADRPGAREVAGQEREGAPGEGEAEVVVDRPAEELEVVGRHEQRAHRDEHEQPEVEGDGARDPDRDGADERNDGERERGPAPGSASRAGGRSARRARGRRLPSRGRTLPRRPRAGPRGARARAPRRSRRSSDARRCRAGGAASRSRASRRARARRRPAAPRSRAPAPEHRAAAEAQAPGLHVLEAGFARTATSRGTGQRSSNSRMLPPRKRPTSCQPGEMTRPSAGRPTST